MAGTELGAALSHQDSSCSAQRSHPPKPQQEQPQGTQEQSCFQELAHGRGRASDTAEREGKAEGPRTPAAQLAPSSALLTEGTGIDPALQRSAEPMESHCQAPHTGTVPQAPRWFVTTMGRAAAITHPTNHFSHAAALSPYLASTSRRLRRSETPGLSSCHLPLNQAPAPRASLKNFPVKSR